MIRFQHLDSFCLRLKFSLCRKSISETESSSSISVFILQLCENFLVFLCLCCGSSTCCRLSANQWMLSLLQVVSLVGLPSCECERQLIRTTFESLGLAYLLTLLLALMRVQISLRRCYALGFSDSYQLGLLVRVNCSSRDGQRLGLIRNNVYKQLKSQTGDFITERKVLQKVYNVVMQFFEILLGRQLLGLNASIQQLQMQHSSQKSSFRPLVFNTKADVHHFVMGNASQAYSLNLPQAARTAPVFHSNSSLFDRYNRPNLRLRDCDPKDIVTLHKNLVMSEQPLSREVIEEVSQKAAKNKHRDLSATGQLAREAHAQPFLRTAPLPVPSVTRQYQQNEVIFNYQGMAELKRTQKTRFLEQIQARIAEAEREIEGLEQLQEEERVEMDDLARVQSRVGEQLQKTYQAGKVKHAVNQAIGFEVESPRVRPPSICQEMQPREINQVLQEHIRINEDLLELAGSVSRDRSKEGRQSKQKVKDNVPSLGNTMKSKQKSLASTMKAGFKQPPKPKPK